MQNVLTIEFKMRLHQYCLDMMDETIQEIKLSISQQKEGVNSSSSAGDKHNAEQAMQHLEQEKKQQQLLVALQNKKQLTQINPERVCLKIQLGALISSNMGMLYFSAPVGKIRFENQEIMLISMASPLSKVLSANKLKQTTQFNGISWTLDDLV